MGQHFRGTIVNITIPVGLSGHIIKSMAGVSYHPFPQGHGAVGQFRGPIRHAVILC